MSSKIKKIYALPKINSKSSYEQNQSSLSKLSSELNTMAIRQDQLIKSNKVNRKLVKKNKTQPKQRDSIQQYSNQLKELKSLVEKKKLQRSIKIQEKLKRLSRLSTQQVSHSMESPRSQINYISMQPPPQQPMYNIYPPPPLYMPPPPYMYNNPFAPSSTPHSPYHRTIGYDETYRDRSRGRRRQYDETNYDRNYDQYDQPERYKKMRQTKTNKKNNLLYLKKMRQKLIKKWRAVVWAIVFSQLLPIYSKKIMGIRSSIFNKFQNKKFNIQLTMMQKYLVKKCKPFFVFIANQKQFQLTMQPGQTDRMDNEKAQVAKKLINFLIQGLNSIKLNDTNQPATNPIQVIHMFCKHGGFVSQFMTQQELDMVSISEKHKYLRLDRNMQISQIINFLCNKILLYNTILNPSKVDAKIFPSDNQIINKNFHFFGSIWYELCLQVQDQYLCQVPTEYQIGNWRKFRQKLGIQPAKSLSVNGSVKQQDQMVSGLLGKKNIEQIFGTNFWRKQKNNLKNALQSVHQVIVDYHKKLKEQIKF